MQRHTSAPAWGVCGHPAIVCGGTYPFRLLLAVAPAGVRSGAVFRRGDDRPAASPDRLRDPARAADARVHPLTRGNPVPCPVFFTNAASSLGRPASEKSQKIS